MKAPFQVLVLGTGSHVGKSLVAAGLCRLLAERGYRVAPFKAQNMALNSAVADLGGEIGRAQALQALAARVPSDTRMNPVLLKPDGQGSSQWILLGRSQGSFGTRDYFRRCWPKAALEAKRAWRSLAQDHEALVMEGAGSPAEVNLSHRDLANVETARFSRAPFILVADVERGGSFAALIGTLELLPAWLRRRCLGVVFNKFRGDVSLMEGGLSWLRRRGIRPLGVLPWCEGLRLEEEDSLGLPFGKTLTEDKKALVIDVISSRFISNFNDMLPLRDLPGVQLRWVKPGQERSPADLVILPGSKSSVADLRVLRDSGEAERLEVWRRQGTWFLGLCGGFQMMGLAIEDPKGIDRGALPDQAKSGGGRRSAVGRKTQDVSLSKVSKTPADRGLTARVPGLAWLPVETRMELRKVLRRQSLVARTSLGVLPLEGYEIHQGRTRLGSGLRLEAKAKDGSPLLLRSKDGRVWGSYLHGILDRPEFRGAFLAKLAAARGKRLPKGHAASARSQAEERERSLESWARHLERHLDLGFLPPAKGAA